MARGVVTRGDIKCDGAGAMEIKGFCVVALAPPGKRHTRGYALKELKPQGAEQVPMAKHKQKRKHEKEVEVGG